MKLKFNGFLTLLVVLVTQIAFAQDRSVSGTVSDNAGLPIPGASVFVKGTKTGTQTDANGKYTIKADENATLVVSYIGMATKQVSAKSSVVNVKLADDAVQLEGVVVTSQGIKREKKALGYAVSQVKAKDLEQKSEGDVARILNGKAAGVQITNASGISGAGTNINIRGYYTVNGSSQPLFIVDGVPFASNTNTQGSFVNGNSGSSRFLDLDPNNIESVNVLKGLAAATLYGSEGRNGVILITTKSGSNKKGSKKTEISIAQSVFANEIASLPDYQNTFGNGFDQAFGNFYSNWGPGFYKDGIGGWINPASGIGADGTIPHPYAYLSSVFPEYAGKRVPYTAKPNNVKDFFRTGVVLNTSINVNGASADGKMNYSVSYGRLSDEGFTPGNKLSRNTFSFGGKAILSNKFTVTGNLSYANTDFLSPPVALSTGSGASGTGLSVYSDVFYTPRNVDLNGLPYENPLTKGSIYYRTDGGIVNPWWTVNNAYVKQLTNRVYGNASLKYDFNDHLNLTYRVGMDNYTESNESGTNTGSGGASTTGPVLGAYRTFDNKNTIWDHTISLNGRYGLTEDLNLSFNAGVTSRSTVYDRQGVSSVDQLSYGIFKHYNFRTQIVNGVISGSTVTNQYYQARNIWGFYGQTEFDYKKWAYLTMAVRKDYSSNIINNNITYPSASLAVDVTNLIPNLASENGINYLKLRTGYGTSANFPEAYPVDDAVTLTASGVNDDAGVTYPVVRARNYVPNLDLKPELLEEVEFGVESKFFNRRVSLDFSFFKRTTNNLIIDQPLGPSTGGSETTVNVGKVSGEGLEIDLGLNILRSNTDGLVWDINSNFTKSKSKVLELPQGVDKVVYAGYTNQGNAAIVGQPLGVLVGSRVARDPNGNLIVQSTGNYRTEEGIFVIGDPNPDFILNVANSFSYKNFTLGFSINYTQGGDIFSQTIATLMGRGLTTDTMDRLNSFVLPGVKLEPKALPTDPDTYIPNDIGINNSDYYFTNLYNGADELAVYDGTVIRLNEISFGYSLPAKLLQKTPFGSFSITVLGNNLYYNAINTPKGINFDPNVGGLGVGNGRGFDHLNGPSGKRYGLSFKATF
jgi:TonB-linked SusC/RagA family outer membrane protein